MCGHSFGLNLGNLFFFGHSFWSAHATQGLSRLACGRGLTTSSNTKTNVAKNPQKGIEGIENNKECKTR